MDRVLQPATDKINYNKCSRCKTTMDSHSSFKTCLSCRVKDKARQEKSRLKMQQQQYMSAQSDADINREYGATSASVKEHQENATRHDGSRKVSAGVKRKAQKSLSELEGEERMVALKMAKKSLTEIIQRQGKKPMPTVDVKSVQKGDAYLIASSLYDALKSKALSSYPANKYETQFLQFHGFHTIVAVPSIDNFKRIKLVATDLRKIARLSFELDAMSSLGPSGSVTLSYLCNCIGHTQAAAPSRDDKLNGSGSLLQWARARSKVASTSNQATPRLCGGKVNITVMDDNTHSLDILGQQITVRVEHPNV